MLELPIEGSTQLCEGGGGGGGVTLCKSPVRGEDVGIGVGV